MATTCGVPDWDDGYEDPTALTDEERKVVAESFRQFDAMKAAVMTALAEGDGIRCSQCSRDAYFPDLEAAKVGGWVLVQEGPLCPACLAKRLKGKR